METDPRPQAEKDSELLTAYLDGELSESETIAVEKRLATDSEFRSQMQELQNAWDMLDALPLVRPDSAFVRTTVEMAIAGKQKSGISGWITMGLLGLVIAGLPLSSFAVSYLQTRETIEQPVRELIEELPLIENFDRYSKVVSDNNPRKGIRFLQSIYKQGLFSEVEGLLPVESVEPVSDLTATTEDPSPNTIQTRNDRLTRMTEEQREDLFAKQQKFEVLPPENQEAIRKFHNLLVTDPQQTRLLQALVSYYDWLKTLNTTQLNEVLDSPPEKRLTKIRKITRLQAREAFGRLGSTSLPFVDAEAFYRWYSIANGFHNEDIRKQAASVFTRIRREKGIPTDKEDIERVNSGPMEQLVDFLLRHDRENFGELITTNEFGLEHLENQLTNSSQSILNELDTLEERQELVLRWIEVANKTRFPIQTSNLKKFYQTLSREKKDEIAIEHPNDWFETLKRLYWEKNGILLQATPDEDFQRFIRESGLDSEFPIEIDEWFR